MRKFQFDAAKFMSLRQVARRTLPFADTFVSFDVVMLILAADERKTPINIKAINAILPYSPSYMRQIFRDLESRRLIDITRDPRDKRNSLVKPARALRDAFAALCADSEAVMTGHEASFDVADEIAKAV